MPQVDYLNLESATAYLTLHPDTLRRKASKGLVEHRRIGSGARARYRFKREWLDDFLNHPTTEIVVRQKAVPQDSAFAAPVARKASSGKA